jgi:hypothetical protein
VPTTVAVEQPVAVLTRFRPVGFASSNEARRAVEKFFDRVNHDGLMARVAARLTDKRVLKLIRAFLNAGVMEDGLVHPVDEGTPRGGPFAPLK